jgi:DNA-binding transcriptional MerR regulator
MTDEGVDGWRPAGSRMWAVIERDRQPGPGSIDPKGDARAKNSNNGQPAPHFSKLRRRKAELSHYYEDQGANDADRRVVPSDQFSMRMLRFYEEKGLLAPSRRGLGYRDYSAADERVIRRIRMLSEACLKLDVIRTVLPCVLNNRSGIELCDEVRATLIRQIGVIEGAHRLLQSSRKSSMAISNQA